MNTVYVIKNGESPYRLASNIMQVLNQDVTGKRVFIKPNITQEWPPKYGITTNPDFCRGIIDYLKNNGTKNITVGEGTGRALDLRGGMLELFRKSGYWDLARKTGAGIINLNLDSVVELRVPNPIVWETVKVAKSVLDADILINVPTLKTHHVAIVTAGIKNLMGITLPIEERGPRFHQKLFALREKAKKENRKHLNRGEFRQAHREISSKILDLYKAVTRQIPMITIIDGFCCREGNGFITGKNMDMRIAIAGENAVETDAIAAYIAGFNPKEIYYLKKSAEENLGNIKLSEIKLKGEDPRSLKKPFRVFTVMDEDVNTWASTILEYNAMKEKNDVAHKYSV